MHNHQPFVGRIAVFIGLITLLGSGNSLAGQSDGVKIQNDESLTKEEYIRLGIPALDREWSAEDMGSAAKVLITLATKNSRQLPRHKSERSGAVFAKIVSSHHLGAVKDKNLDMDTRVGHAADYLKSGNAILKVYLILFTKKEGLGAEVVELFGMQFRLTSVMLDLVDEALPTLKKDDPTYLRRMQGLEQMKRGLAQMVTGCLQVLSETRERERQKENELATLIGHMQESFPVIIPRLQLQAQTQSLQSLEKLQVDPALKNLQPALVELYRKVKASVDKTAGSK